MRTLPIEDVRHAVLGRWRKAGEKLTVSAVTTDSRAAGPGSLFVALRGENFDGHDFLAQAAAAGCVAAIVDQEAYVDEAVLGSFPGGVIGVGDTILALGELATWYRGHLPGTVISITGSNGKTTVKRMVAHILSRRLAGLASPKSFNNNIGVPLTLLSAGPEDEYVICETGSNAPGEIATLAAIERPDIAVITSVGETHLEKLIDIEHVAAEKASLLGSLDPRGLAIVNADSIPLERALRGYSCRMIRFGRNEKADVRLTGFEPTEGGCRFQLNGRRWFDLAVPGEHMACNALAAIAVAQRLGFEQDQAGEALADYRGEEMRLQMIQAGSVRIINDAYNANPASMAAAAASLASFSAQRKVVVAGDMRELGPQGVALHAAVGDKMARAGVDLVVGVGPLGRHIAAGAERAGANTAQIETVEEACRKLPSLLREGDLVLIKGSRGMKMERLVEPIQAAFGYQGQGCCTERKN